MPVPTTEPVRRRWTRVHPLFIELYLSSGPNEDQPARRGTSRRRRIRHERVIRRRPTAKIAA